MIFGSLCSGIEAASTAWQTLGWEAAWFCEWDKFPLVALMRRRKKATQTQRNKWNLFTRYRLTPEKYNQLLKKQNHLCALCGGVMERPVVDHDHVTKKVRGILCHPCNIKLPTVEDMGWVMLAWAYLEGEDLTDL